MTDRCPTLDELLRQQTSPTDGRASAHLNECPRCQALLAAFAEFRASRTEPGDARPADAEEALGRFLERELGGNVVPGPRRAAPWIPLAAAALLLIAIGVPRVVNRSDDDSRAIRLRSAPADSTRSTDRLESLAIESRGRQLSWDPIDDAVTYEVRLFDADLKEIRVIDVGAATTWRFPPPDPEGAPEGIPTWGAIAVRRGPSEVEVSRLVPLRAP